MVVQQSAPRPLRVAIGAGLGRATYGANYARLLAVKRQYDPENLFRLNPNIDPAGYSDL